MKFNEQVWRLLEKIPPGRVSTYKQIAVALHNRNAARAVGNACNRNPNAPVVPCHRVVCSNGQVGDYANGQKKKIALLEKEGVRIKNNKVVNFSALKTAFGKSG